MANRLEQLRRGTIGKSSIDAVFLRNKQMLGVNEDQIIRESYKKSDLVYVCISTTAKAISQIPLMAVKTSGQGGQYRPLPESDPWVKLIERPNYITDKYSFIESIITHLLLDGEVFVVPFPPKLNPPSSLWIVRNKFISPARDSKTGLLMGWLYNQSGHTTESGNVARPDSIPLGIDEVARIFLINPYDPLRGMSPIEAGKMSIVVDYKSAFYTSVFFDEGASPGGVISTEQKLGDKQFNRTREQFESRHQGFRKAHRVAVLEQELKYTQTGLSQKDMEFADLRKLSAERIYQVFGMKKAIVSVVEDVNYATAREERKEWWEGTNLPLMSMITSALNFVLFRDSSNVKLIFDITAIAALKDALESKVTTGYKLWQMGYTANEINDRLDLGFGTKSWRNIGYIAANILPVERAINPPEPPPAIPALPPAPSEEVPLEEPPKALSSGIDDKVPDKDDIRNERLWENFLQKLDGLEEKFEKKVTRVFADMRRRSLDNLYKSAKAPKDLDDEFFLDDSKNISKFTDPIYERSLIIGFASLFEETGEEIFWSVSDAEAQAFLLMKNIKIKGIIQTIKNQIRIELMESYQNGETIDQIADRIRRVFNVSKSRARTIARTEIIGTANEGRHLAIGRSGFGERQWFTAMDERVRPQHRMMHGMKAKLGEPWVMPDSTSLRFPGDSNGPAHQVINCRCIETVVPESHHTYSGDGRAEHGAEQKRVEEVEIRVTEGLEEMDRKILEMEDRKRQDREEFEIKLEEVGKKALEDLEEKRRRIEELEEDSKREKSELERKIESQEDVLKVLESQFGLVKKELESKDGLLGEVLKDAETNRGNSFDKILEEVRSNIDLIKGMEERYNKELTILNDLRQNDLKEIRNIVGTIPKEVRIDSIKLDMPPTEVKVVIEDKEKPPKLIERKKRIVSFVRDEKGVLKGAEIEETEGEE